MQKTLLTITTCALLLVAFPTTTASSDDEPITTISTGNGGGQSDHVQVCNGQLALGSGPWPPGPPGDFPGCTFTPEVNTGAMTIGFQSLNAGNVPGGIPLSGTITADLQSASGREVVFSCTWVQGAFAGCQIDSLTGWPAVGEGFTYDCYSQFMALGNWGECFVSH